MRAADSPRISEQHEPNAGCHRKRWATSATYIARRSHFSSVRGVIHAYPRLFASLAPLR
jgi:hypothetical protein